MDTTKELIQITKKDLALRKKDFLISETCKSFHELVAIFTTLPFFIYFNAKLLIKLKTNTLDCIISEIFL